MFVMDIKAFFAWNGCRSRRLTLILLFQPAN